MTWMLLQATVGGRPHVIKLNKKYFDPSLRLGLTHGLEIRAYGFEVKANGLPSSASLSEIYRVDDELENAASRIGARSVMTQAGNGEYIWLYYGPESLELHPISEVLAAVPLKAEVAFGEDPSWEYFAYWMPQNVGNPRSGIFARAANAIRQVLSSTR